MAISSSSLTSTTCSSPALLFVVTSLNAIAPATGLFRPSPFSSFPSTFAFFISLACQCRLSNSQSLANSDNNDDNSSSSNTKQNLPPEYAPKQTQPDVNRISFLFRLCKATSRCILLPNPPPYPPPPDKNSLFNKYTTTKPTTLVSVVLSVCFSLSNTTKHKSQLQFSRLSLSLSLSLSLACFLPRFSTDAETSSFG